MKFLIFKKTTFQYHRDDIPKKDKNVRSGRIQCFIVFQSSNTTSYSGQTIFIKG